MNVTPEDIVNLSTGKAVSSVDQRSRWRPMLWMLRLATMANVIGVLFVYLMIHVVSESHWIGIILTYFPRMLYPLPALVLAIFAWRWSRRLAAINLVMLFVAAGPIMEFRYGGVFAGPASDDAIKILSCNVQRYEPDFLDVLREIDSLDPDIVAFQESNLNYPPQIEYFHKKPWNQAGFHQFRVFSKYPIKELPNTGLTTGHGRWPLFCVGGFEIETDQGSFYVFNLHQSTPRNELSDLSAETLFSGESALQIEKRRRYRVNESRMIREYIDNLRGDRPFVVVGDFNAPSSSSFYQTNWGDLQNAFDRSGFGYGYTANCETQSHWPTGLPWARVDHILGSDEIRFERCITGKSNGSDHRLIMAWMTLNPSKH